MAKKVKALSQYHVKVAAEAIAAAQFARLGLDVSIQYGADQPEYDLIVARGDKLLKVSVKGSQDGSWGLTQNLLRNAKYHDAVDVWLTRHSSKTIFCLVQLVNVELDELPRLYLATPAEIGSQLKKTANGRGDTILFENYTYKRKHAAGYGTTDKIPDNWKFSRERFDELMNSIS